MPINEWSESILISEMSDEPGFSEDMEALLRRLDSLGDDLPDVIVDMRAVSYLNSSNIAQLLKLRKKLLLSDARLRVCSMNDACWSVLLITGLDKIFEFTEDVATSLASLQIDEPE
ncbi:MAG: STAS domain-containing protein [Planctomycetota bacterium]